MTDQNAILRILDANFNRAREALRVMEEFARFVLDDASLTGACKTLRHELVGLARGLEAGGESDGDRDGAGPHTFQRSDAPEGPGETDADRESARTDPRHVPPRPGVRGSLAAHRDIAGDAGREVDGPGEFQRSGAADVAVAAGKRLSEALRSLEEYGKTLDAGFAEAMERLRYRGYEVERRLSQTVTARERFGDIHLYVIITEALCARNWFSTAEAALDGGADCLQLREKDLPDAELLSRAKRLAELCRAHDRRFLVNDRADVAAAVGAHGVHLGQDDLPVAAARRILPAWAVIGKSTHTVEQLEQAAAEAPDYLAVGPMFPSRTKPQDHIAGPATLRAARAATSLPLVAIGGIDETNAAAVLGVGPIGLCVCSAVVARPDPREAARQLRRLAEASRTSRQPPDPTSR